MSQEALISVKSRGGFPPPSPPQPYPLGISQLAKSPPKFQVVNKLEPGRTGILPLTHLNVCSKLASKQGWSRKTHII